MRSLASLLLASSLCASTAASAESFEVVLETEMPVRQFLTDSFGYGFGTTLGVMSRFENDTIDEAVALNDAREAANYIDFVDPSTGVVATVNLFSSNQTLIVYDTSDGGVTWNELGTFAGFGAPTIRWYSDDSAYVIAAAQEDSNALVVWQTTDRFQTSTEVTWTSPNGGGDKIDFARRVIPVSADVMYAPDGGAMLVTNDGAQTWTQSESLTGLGSNGVLVGTPNVIIRQYNSNTNFSTWVSSDAGQSFVEATTPVDDVHLDAVDFLDDQNGLAVVRIGPNQMERGVMRTSDGGVTWTQDTLPAAMQGSPFLPHYVSAEVQYVSTDRELLRVGVPTGMPANNSGANNQPNNANSNNASANNTNGGSTTGGETNTGQSGGGEDDGGCSTSRGAGDAFALLVFAFALLVRRRRPSPSGRQS